MEMTTETKTLIGVLIGTVVIVVGGALLFNSGSSGTGGLDGTAADSDRLVRAESHSKGPDDAAVTVVEFGDFQCPACGAVHPILQQLKEQNADASVRFVFRQFPLTQIHEHAQEAAEAAEAAAAQGKFWEYHDLLFENQENLTRDDLISYAQQLELDVDRFTTELDDGTYRTVVTQGVSDGTAVGVPGTPTFFINGMRYSGQYSLESFQAAIDEVLTNAL